MDKEKGALKSKGIVGVGVMILGTLLGWNEVMQTEMTSNIMFIASGIVSVVGAVVACVGRVKAESKIKGWW
jgi:hypothetical protein